MKQGILTTKNCDTGMIANIAVEYASKARLMEMEY
jgi:hypothetical protein